MRRARIDDTRFVVDRRGDPQIVIMGIRDFLKTIAPEKKTLAAIRQASRKRENRKLSMRESIARFVPTAASARSSRQWENFEWCSIPMSWCPRT
jgi:hypothetical protein